MTDDNVKIPFRLKLIDFASRTILKPVYKVYEKWLWYQIKDGPIPKHVAVIPDGNRRWAKRLGLEVWSGHKFGYVKIKEVLKWCWELGIRTVTVYALSTENIMKRSKRELEELFQVIRRGFKELLESEHIHKHKVHVKVIGRLHLLPEDIREYAKKVEDETKDYTNHYLIIALGYGGRQEIVDAVRRLTKDVLERKLSVESIDEETFSKYLYTGDIPYQDPDLIIRTSGEERLSGFLLWQSAYSELYFCEAYWPEFRKIDFWRAIRSYQKRERRFGK